MVGNLIAGIKRNIKYVGTNGRTYPLKFYNKEDKDSIITPHNFLVDSKGIKESFDIFGHGTYSLDKSMFPGDSPRIRQDITYQHNAIFIKPLFEYSYGIFIKISMFGMFFDKNRLKLDGGVPQKFDAIHSSFIPSFLYEHEPEIIDRDIEILISFIDKHITIDRIFNTLFEATSKDSALNAAIPVKLITTGTVQDIAAIFDMYAINEITTRNWMECRKGLFHICRYDTEKETLPIPNELKFD